MTLLTTQTRQSSVSRFLSDRIIISHKNYILYTNELHMWNLVSDRELEINFDVLELDIH